MCGLCAFRDSAGRRAAAYSPHETRIRKGRSTGTLGSGRLHDGRLRQRLIGQVLDRPCESRDRTAHSRVEILARSRADDVGEHQGVDSMTSSEVPARRIPGASRGGERRRLPLRRAGGVQLLRLCL